MFSERPFSNAHIKKTQFYRIQAYANFLADLPTGRAEPRVLVKIRVPSLSTEVQADLDHDCVLTLLKATDASLTTIQNYCTRVIAKRCCFDNLLSADGTKALSCKTNGSTYYVEYIFL